MEFVLSTYPSLSAAAKSAKMAIRAHLAGCVLKIPIGSHYRWRGKVVNDKEVLAVFKTTREKVKKLMKRIEAQHPCEVPFIAIIPSIQVNNKYQQWLAEELKSG